MFVPLLLKYKGRIYIKLNNKFRLLKKKVMECFKDDRDVEEL